MLRYEDKNLRFFKAVNFLSNCFCLIVFHCIYFLGFLTLKPIYLLAIHTITTLIDLPNSFKIWPIVMLKCCLVAVVGVRVFFFFSSQM